MFGKNPIMKQDKGNGRTLRVVESSPFYTIQGEGPFVGHPAIFIRLHGCNLRCWFCDTNFSDPSDPIWNTVDLARAVWDMSFNHSKCRLVVLTGGEPMRQNILPLCKLLIDQGFTVQIETAGTLWVDGLDELVGPVTGHALKIIVSPKTGTVHPSVAKAAYAYKYVIGADMEFSHDGVPYAATQAGTRPKPLAAPPQGKPVYLSPLDEYDEEKNARNVQMVAKRSMLYGYIAGVQLHKLMNIEEPV